MVGGRAAARLPRDLQVRKPTGTGRYGRAGRSRTRHRLRLAGCRCVAVPRARRPAAAAGRTAHVLQGKRLAVRRGGRPDHSEHHLVLFSQPSSGPHRPEISLRPATVSDVPLVVSLLEQGFGWPGPDDLGDRLKRTAVLELRGTVVGTLFLELDDDEEASIFGFVIKRSLQGRGIGRAALRKACHQLRADGARRISLDVDVVNDRALGLYTSIGFTRVTTEDYFALPLD